MPAKQGPCYRCLYPEPPPPGWFPRCAEGGVLGVLPGIAGVIQATEVIKLILGAGEPLIGRLVLVDALAMRFRELRVRKNPECPVCGTNPTVKELIDYNQFCGIRGEESEAAPSAKIPEIQLRGTQAPTRRAGGYFRARCARAARVSDRQHSRAFDSAWRSADSAFMNSTQP